MSIYYSGTLARSGGIISAIAKEMKQVNLKGVKRITVSFDPFAPNVKSAREFLFLLSSPRISKTNPNCALKTEVHCNRQPAEIKFTLIPSEKDQNPIKDIRFIAENLNTLELLQLCNKHVTPLAPTEELSTKALTKLEKQKLAGTAKKAIKKK